MKKFKRILLSVLALGVSLAVYAMTYEWSAPPNTVGNPIGSSQGDRNEIAMSTIGNYLQLGAAPLPGDIINITFGDGWKQPFTFNRDQYGTPSISPLIWPYATNNANTGEPDGQPTCSGSYHATYGTANVTNNGEVVYSDPYISGYVYDGNC